MINFGRRSKYLLIKAPITSSTTGHAITDPRLPRTLASLLKATGFALQRQGVIALLNTQYNSSTYSHCLADLIIRFVPTRKGIDYDEVLSWGKDLEH